MAYFGKSVPVESFLDDISREAEKSGFTVETLVEVADLPLLALSRRGPAGAPSVYLSAGIHGDEPAGSLALLELLETDLSEEVTWHICPMLNPGGAKTNSRNSPANVDLNRDYLALTQPEVKAHAKWLGTCDEFTLSICLHEDWEANGFYLYELNPHPERSVASEIVRAVEPVCPVDHSERIDGHAARNGVIIPNKKDLQRDDWPEALYLFTHHTGIGYTLETPSGFPLRTRVEAHVAGCLAAVRALLAHKAEGID